MAEPAGQLYGAWAGEMAARKGNGSFVYNADASFTAHPFSHTIVMNPTVARTVTMPDASLCFGAIICIYATTAYGGTPASYNVTVAGPGANNNLNTFPTIVLSANGYFATLRSNGLFWEVVDSKLS